MLKFQIVIPPFQKLFQKKRSDRLTGYKKKLSQKRWNYVIQRAMPEESLLLRF